MEESSLDQYRRTFPRRTQFYFETWFLASDRHPVCLRSRRFVLHRDMTCSQVQQHCLWLWADLLATDQDISIHMVHPKPETLMSSVAHLIVLQGAGPRHAGIVIKQEHGVQLDKCRAALVFHDDSVADIMFRAQLASDCYRSTSRCYLLDPSRGYRRFDTRDIPHLRSGSYVIGDVMILAPHHPLEGVQGNVNSDDDTDTTVPTIDSSDDDSEEDDEERRGAYGFGLEANSDLQQVTPQTCPLPDRGPREEALPWDDIPLSFRIQDVFEGTPTDLWTYETTMPSQHEAHEEASLMQRDRSRSRNHTDPSGSEEDPELDSQESAQSSHTGPTNESDAMVAWGLIYTNMTEEPVTVQAGRDGPTIAQAAQATRFPLHEILNIYPVQSLAAEQQEHIALLHCRSDYISVENEVLLLFEIVCRDTEREAGEVGQPHLFHSPHIARRRHSFSTFTHTMRLAAFFQRFSAFLRLTHNGQLWRPDDPSFHSMNNGDHVEIRFADEPHPEYRQALREWIRAEGLAVWPSLQPTLSEHALSPTLPFVANDYTPLVCQEPDVIPGQGFKTWYISHTRHEQCTEYRVIFMAHHPTDWTQALQRVWRDRFDVVAPYSLTWVSPQPPTNTDEHAPDFPHLLVEQHHTPQKVGVVLTTRANPVINVEFAQGAFSIPDRMPIDGYLQLMDVLTPCRYRFECEVSCGSLILRDSFIIRRPTGQSITISAQARNNPSVSQVDIQSFMQLSGSRSHGDLQPEVPADTGGTTGPTPFCELFAAGFDPDFHLQDSYGEVRALLQAVFDRVRQDLPETAQDTVEVATYYLSPLRTTRCAFARAVCLMSDPTFWAETLVAAWIDHIDITMPIDIYVVQPHPPQNRDVTIPFAAYVLIVQHQTPSLCPVLTTIAEDHHFLHVAHFVPRLATARAALLAAGVGPQCIGRQPTAWCCVSLGTTALSEQIATHVPPGANLVVVPLSQEGQDQHAYSLHLERQTASDDDPLHQVLSQPEGFSMLQISAQSRAVYSPHPAGLALPVATSNQQVPHDPLLEELNAIIRPLLHDPWQGLNQDFDFLPDIHPAAQWAVQLTTQVQHGHPVFHVFTDASWKQEEGAWAFVVLHDMGLTGYPRFARRGYAGGVLEDLHLPVIPGAQDAEATALIAAAEYLLSNFAHHHNMEVHLHFDSATVGFGAKGQQKMPAQYGTVSQRQQGARALIAMLERAAVTVQAFHVHAHEHNPFNEMVDSLATCIRQGWRPPIKAQLRSHRLLQHRLRDSHRPWTCLILPPFLLVNRYMMNSRGLMQISSRRPTRASPVSMLTFVSPPST
eukprot:Skav211229  [mRNA]  locus=scaffold934:347778:351692:- [translate_table: standard]